MEKLQVFQVLETNKILYKIFEQKTSLPISVGLKIYRIMKIFDEVEEYVFETMDLAYPNFNWMSMTEDEKIFYQRLISEQIELDYEKIPTELFEKNDNLMLTVEDIGALSIILC